MEYSIAVAHGNDSGSEWNTELCLPHPATGQQACFLLHGQTFQEINWFKPEYGSWFVGDMVIQDGSLTLGTPCDPLFVLLPLLATATQLVSLLAVNKRKSGRLHSRFFLKAS